MKRYLPHALVVITIVCGLALEWNFPRSLWHVSPGADRETLRAALDAKDIASYDVAHYLDYTTSGWQAAFWPPGTALVGRAVGNDEYAHRMMLVAAALWLTCLLTLVHRHGWRATPLALLPLFPISRAWMLGPGALGSESFAGAFFVASLGTRRFEWLLLAIAAYFRAEYEFYGLVVLGVFALRARTRETVIALAAFYALTVPWKLHTLSRFGHYAMSLSLHHAAETEYWKPTPPPYAYGGNTPCIADPETCAKIAPVYDRVPTGEKIRLARRALLLHPIRWLGYKLGFVGKFWFEDGALLEIVEMLALLLLGMWLPPLRAAAFVGAMAVVYLFVHFETRYSLPLRLFLAAGPLLAQKKRAPGKLPDALSKG